MLVVTRRPNEKILLPTVGVTVHILDVVNRRARVGIDAPPGVKILREEVHAPGQGAFDLAADRKARHDLANALNKATIAIHLARTQCETGRFAAADATLETALHALDAAAETQARADRRYRMLIVEDDPNERELLAGLLGMNGCECATAADGIDALTYLERNDRPDAVLLDMMMPRLSGPETLRRIRADQRYAGLRVYSVSGTPPSELDVPEGPRGLDGWFPKPLNPRRMWDTIQTALRSAAASN
jgi:carbon storage regulator CsrA